MTTRTFALIFGIVFLIVGIGGFIPGLTDHAAQPHPDLRMTQGYGHELGLFPINVLHNIVHLLFGVWGLVASRSLGASVGYARGVAIIYAVLTVMGLVPGLSTTFGFIPWDDTHHTELSMTNGTPDGRWLFINGNNTPRVARIDLTRMETDEILQIPNAAGGHASPFTTPDTKYIVSATRFSVPVPNTDVPIESYKQNFKGTLSFIRADQPGKMDIAFQILMPGFNYDLGHSGKGPSDGWFFFTSYNTEQANTMLETNASQNDKDYVAAVNYHEAEECVEDGKAKTQPAEYYHNYMDEATRTARVERKTSVRMLDPKDCPGIVYFLPTPKSPHGVDVDPTGEYIVAGGKLATVIPVHSATKPWGHTRMASARPVPARSRTTSRMSGPRHGSGMAPALCQACDQPAQRSSPAVTATASADAHSSSG